MDQGASYQKRKKKYRARYWICKDKVALWALAATKKRILTLNHQESQILTTTQVYLVVQ